MDQVFRPLQALGGESCGEVTLKRVGRVAEVDVCAENNDNQSLTGPVRIAGSGSGDRGMYVWCLEGLLVVVQ